jgi:uncharacterized membrane protein
MARFYTRDAQGGSWYAHRARCAAAMRANPVLGEDLSDARRRTCRRVRREKLDSELVVVAGVLSAVG